MILTSDPNTALDTNLDCFEGLPPALLDAPASELHRHLRGPSLFRIAGRAGAPLFVSVLLHGNEDAGWRAAQAVLRRHPIPPRPLLLFVGNIRAAAAKVRTLPEQDDFNRVWPGTERPESATAGIMRDVLEIVRGEKPFASIDIHNNTGRNPHYACVSSRAEPHLHLARLFGRTVVYFQRPIGVQSAALATICPAVTVECGRAEDAGSAEHAAEFIAAALALQHFPEHPVPAGDIDLLQTFAVVKIPPHASFSYDGAEADFRLRSDLDRLNFCELGPGTSFELLGGAGGKQFDVQPAEDGAPVTPCFDYTDGEIRLTRPAMPSMLTLDPNAVRLDCLGYLMHRIHRDGRPMLA